MCTCRGLPVRWWCVIGFQCREAVSCRRPFPDPTTDESTPKLTNLIKNRIPGPTNRYPKATKLIRNRTPGPTIRSPQLTKLIKTRTLTDTAFLCKSYTEPTNGDGTQELFYQDPSVLTISLHVALTSDGLAFPGKRSMGLGYLGRGGGLGYNINIPWPHDGVGADEYKEAFETIVVPALRSFGPELVIVASGFDAVAGDMLAGTCLHARGYYDLPQQLLAQDLPLAVILEGGYSPHLIAEASLNVAHALLGREPPPVKAASPSSMARAASTGGGDGGDIRASCILEAVRRHLNTVLPWSTMRGVGKPCFPEDPSGEAASSSRDAAANISELIERLAAKD